MDFFPKVLVMLKLKALWTKALRIMAKHGGHLALFSTTRYGGIQYRVFLLRNSFSTTPLTYTIIPATSHFGILVVLATPRRSPAHTKPINYCHEYVSYIKLVFILRRVYKNNTNASLISPRFIGQITIYII